MSLVQQLPGDVRIRLACDPASSVMTAIAFLLTKVQPPPEQEGKELRTELAKLNVPLFTA
jgi:hypothetical protein